MAKTNEEYDEEVRKGEEARQIAAAFLAAQNRPLPNTSQPMSTAPPVTVEMGPAEMEPAPPPPSPKSGGMDWRDAAVIGAGVVGGPTAALGVKGLVAKPPPMAPKKDPPKPEAEEEPPPSPQAPGADPFPMGILQQGGGGAVIPGGMHLDTVQTREGHPVPAEARKAYGASTKLALEGADAQRQADHAYYDNVRNLQEQKLRATEDAAVSHARIQAERDGLVRKRLAQIEATNAEASAQIDTNKYWTDRGAFAPIIGAIAVALGEYGSKMNGGPNTALHIIENGVNREVQSQLANRQGAGQRAQRQVQLLDLHLARLGDQDKAVDATKLALYDNALTQLEAHKAQHGAQVSEAKYLDLQAGILEKRGEVVNKMGLQEMGDIVATDRYRGPQVIGGVGRNKEVIADFFKQTAPGDVVPVPPSSVLDGKVDPLKVKLVAVKNGTTAARLQQVGGAVGALMENNRRADELLRRLDNTINPMEIREISKELDTLANNKINVASVKDDQGVVKEPEYLRAVRTDVHYNSLAVLSPASTGERARVRNMLRKQNEQMYRQFAGEVKAAGDGSVVAQRTIRDPTTGVPRTVHFPTGEVFQPEMIEPEKRPVK